MRLFLCLMLLLMPAVPAVAAGRLDPMPRVAVMSAFAPELVRLLEATEQPQRFSENGIDFTTGRLGGRPVVLVLSGISMVNAAMTTQMLLDRFQVTALVFSGIAGGVDPALMVGDVAVPRQWGQFMESYMAREEQGRFKPPVWATTPYPNFDMLFPAPVTMRSTAKPAGEKQFWFAADPALLAVAERVAPQVPLERCNGPDHCLDHAPAVRVGGNGVTGPAFVDNARLRAYLFSTFQARVVDMESAAVAMVAQQNGVPFIAFRSLSDLAGGDQDENRMYTFLSLAAGNAARVVVAFLQALPPPVR